MNQILGKTVKELIKVSLVRHQANLYFIVTEARPGKRLEKEDVVHT